MIDVAKQVGMRIKPYDDHEEWLWDNFVNGSKNSTFMFYRDYMDYHSDRFNDNSLIFLDGEEPVAVLPANLDEGSLISHGGLTFGGLLTDENMKVEKMMDIFDCITSYGESNAKINELVYKCVPYIYHEYPADEDLYALFRNDAELIRRDISTAVNLNRPLQFQKNRRRVIDDAEDAKLTVRESTDFESYWDILEFNLDEEHDTEPVHTLDEIKMLHERFPDNIRLYASFNPHDTMLAGVVVYQSSTVARTQYIANSSAGRDVGALDIVFDRLIHEELPNTRYLDFGISTEEAGKYLNEGLVFYKQGFGSRAVSYDFYRLTMNN